MVMMYLFFVEEGVYEWVEVVDVNLGLGVFVNIGMNKDMLIGLIDLFVLEDLWSEVGNKVYCIMKILKCGKMYGKIVIDDVMKVMVLDVLFEFFNCEVSGYIYCVLCVGLFIMIDEGYVGFIYESERCKELKFGIYVIGCVINVKEDGMLNVLFFLCK